MNGIHKFSAQVIDYAERLSDVADAAQGKNHRQAGSAKRWLLLPASGGALYAIVKSDSFSRQAKDVMDDAKTRAAELPEELIGLVRQTRTARPARTEAPSLARPRPRGRSPLRRGGGAPRVSRPLPSARPPRRQQAPPSQRTEPRPCAVRVASGCSHRRVPQWHDAVLEVPVGLPGRKT
jgi:hypothetical protein